MWIARAAVYSREQFYEQIMTILFLYIFLEYKNINKLNSIVSIRLQFSK